MTAYISELSPVEVKEWALEIRAARLGELIYAEPCPPGYSLVKGALNFKVCKFVAIGNFKFGIVLMGLFLPRNRKAFL